MRGILNLILMTIGGGIGWWIGSFVSIFTAFVISMVGTGLGLWYGQKLTKRLLP